jgi:hypothetical protein
MKPGSVAPLLMSKAKYLTVLAALAAPGALEALPGAAMATPTVPHAASAAPAAMIAARRPDLFMLTS